MELSEVAPVVHSAIPILLGWAVLLPLFSFVAILLAGPRMGKGGAFAGYVATGAIIVSCVLSLVALKLWLNDHPVLAAGPHAEASHDAALNDDHADHEHGDHDHADHDHAGAHAPDDGHAGGDPGATHGGAHEHDGPHTGPAPAITGDWYTLAHFGPLRLTIGYYVDALTVAMFCMVTLIASCIHVYATGYMHDELHDYTDHEVTLADGSHLTRPGRYHRFFQALSLFCFAMLGLVVSGNIAMTFVFWELVGICSWFLIGFYVERDSASTAANKAFIVNRVGDFGMIIGLMAIWGSLGTFAFGDIGDQAGMFSQVRPASAHHALTIPDGMVRIAARSEIDEMVASGVSGQALEARIAGQLEQWRNPPEGSGAPRGGYGYWLLCVAGVGIFCGCVGKSAQFPLHVWLPDAMAGPTPVSALVHSATMVAAGVFLTARFYPMFTPDVLLVIAVVGMITLFMAATIAITATDIKRVLAYSTVSQLGYMMLALGVGGWRAGVLHMFTHAFFKSLLFMCSGSVIHAVHSNEMTDMGGLRKKMPWTAYTMLVGCLAIAGAGIPFVIGFSGYYSKDAILEQALLFKQNNPGLGAMFFYAAAGGAAITAFYMFRLWYMTFAGPPRDPHRYEHAHESPPSMVYPLVLLSIFAIIVGWSPSLLWVGVPIAAILLGVCGTYAGWSASWIRLPLIFCVMIGLAWFVFGGVTLADLLEQARPAGTVAMGPARWVAMVWPDEHRSHDQAIAVPATVIAFCTAVAGVLLATVIYCWRKLDAEELRTAFAPIHRFLVNKWWFDELYSFLFVAPSKWLGRMVAAFDRRWIDGLIHTLASIVKTLATWWDTVIDRGLVDGSINGFARLTRSIGLSFHGVQTGRLRQYVLFIVLGVVVLFVMATFFFGYAFAS